MIDDWRLNCVKACFIEKYLHFRALLSRLWVYFLVYIGKLKSFCRDYDRSMANLFPKFVKNLIVR